MATVTLSDRQLAEILTHLGRGEAPARVAARLRISESVVADVPGLYGNSVSAMSKAAREIYRKLRNTPPVEDYETDVPVPPTRAGNPIGDAVVDEAAKYFSQPVSDEFPSVPAELAALVSTAPSDLPHSSEQPPVEVGSVTDADGNGDSVTAEEPSTAPADDPAQEGGWSLPDPRSIERLLSVAKTLPGQPATIARAVEEQLRHLVGLVDDWTTGRKNALLAELDDLGRRQDEILAELQQISGAAIAKQPAPLETDRATAVWFQLTKETRSAVRVWAEKPDLPHAKSGRQPNATVEAYLSAHPDQDPR